ncbi:glycosyl transferase [Halomonas cupida]|nr:glycosyltransferase [Halomonas cupida]GEN26270.1 glycosyl transferase [Halomonas cupida]
MPELKRVLVCANPDLNYIDGSSIWAQTIALVFAETGLATVDFLAKSTPRRDELYQPLCKHRNINVVNGIREIGSASSMLAKRLTHSEMAEVAVKLEKKNDYDVIIVRGYAIAKELLDSPEVFRKCWIYLTDIPQSVEAYSEAEREEISEIGQRCAQLLCQTSGFRDLWKALVPSLPDEKCKLYPPVIPDIAGEPLPVASRQKQVVYAGKFKPDWMTLEMAETWPELYSNHPDAELRMIGDKIHFDSEGFQHRMKIALEHTPGLKWLGAMSREGVQAELHQARVGLSWRDEAMNETLEYSTKILEYGGAGCGAILNRNPLHEELLGEDYPLFANTQEQYINALDAALADDELAQIAADQLMAVAKLHTFGTRVGEASEWLRLLPDRGKITRSEETRKIRVLVAGHDLKFFTPLQKRLEETGKFEFLVDQWTGHNSHDEKKSLELLPQADVIFCEWCLGNLKWYSHHRLPHQRLVARFHAQEAKLPYMADAKWDAIDHIAFVSEHTRKNALGVFGLEENLTSVIPNGIDIERFCRVKKHGGAEFTLGMIGVVPRSKRLDRAIDTLEKLLDEDERYVLRIKGKHPLDYGWLLSRPDEVQYYKDLMNRVNSDPRLRFKVIFDPPGDDVPQWLSMVGYVFSPSDHESFHMAVGEGIAAGATPVVWNWEGAADIWGEPSVVRDCSEARDLVIKGEVDHSLKFPSSYILESVAERWEELVFGFYS